MYISLKYMKEYLGILCLTKTVYENWNDMAEVGFGFSFARLTDADQVFIPLGLYYTHNIFLQ